MVKTTLDPKWMEKAKEVKAKVSEIRRIQSEKKARQAENLSVLLKDSIKTPGGLRIPKPKLSFYVLLEHVMPATELDKLKLSVENVATILYLLENQDKDRCIKILEFSKKELQKKILQFAATLSLEDNMDAYVESVRILFIQTWAAAEVLKDGLEKKTMKAKIQRSPQDSLQQGFSENSVNKGD